MTPAQTKQYWREWSSVKGYCVRHQLPEPDRYELHAKALAGCVNGEDGGPCNTCAERLLDAEPISSKEFNGSQSDRDHFVDLLFATFRAVYQPANLNGQVRQLKQPTKRFEEQIGELLKCLALYVGDAEAYVAGICLDRFHTPDWRDLRTGKDKQHLVFTLSNKLNRKDTGLRNKAGHSLHEMKALAGCECFCAGICMKNARVRLVTSGAGAPEPVMEDATGNPVW